MNKIVVLLAAIALVAGATYWLVARDVSDYVSLPDTTAETGIKPVAATVNDDAILEVLVVQPYTETCYAGWGEWTCMVANDRYLYSDIEGFEFKPGYISTLLVEKTNPFPDGDVPIDAIPERYSLVEIISQVKE